MNDNNKTPGHLYAYLKTPSLHRNKIEFGIKNVNLKMCWCLIYIGRKILIRLNPIKDYDDDEVEFEEDEEDGDEVEEDGDEVDEDGDEVEEDGEEVEEDGDEVDEDGEEVEEDGDEVDEDGEEVEEDGEEVEEDDSDDLDAEEAQKMRLRKKFYFLELDES